MLDGLMDLAKQAMDSPWIYPVLFGGCLADVLLPVLPSDGIVITAGVFSASGKPNLILVIVVCALGAIVGDHLSYWLGTLAGGRFAKRKGKKVEHARKSINERGGLILFVARYIPGGRTVVTLTMGAMGYPRAKFTAFDSLAGFIWATQWALVGYFGGEVFEKSPWKGLVLGFGIAVGVTLVVELVRRSPARRLLETARR
jgi:membrane protein DedA with SNARE-associated domain